MKLEIYKQFWGMDGSTEQMLATAKEHGYDGVEGSIPTDCERGEFLHFLDEYRLKYIPIIYTQGGRNADEHLASFAEQMHEAMEYMPQKINVHGARDYMPADEQLRYYSGVCEFSRDIGIEVCHETHRGRPLGTPWNTFMLLERFPELRLTIDISHWCCVCESLLEEQGREVEPALRSGVHLHGRIGYSQGPQIPDPGAPEYAAERTAHENWWRTLILLRQAEGRDVFTFTPEYGPPPYMHTLPYTNRQVADHMTVCDRAVEQFTALFNASVGKQ